MPTLPSYNRKIMLDLPNNTQANSAAFGAGVSESLGALGNQLQNTSTIIDKYQQDQQELQNQKDLYDIEFKKQQDLQAKKDAIEQKKLLDKQNKELADKAQFNLALSQANNDIEYNNAKNNGDTEKMDQITSNNQQNIKSTLSILLGTGNTDKAIPIVNKGADNIVKYQNDVKDINTTKESSNISNNLNTALIQSKATNNYDSGIQSITSGLNYLSSITDPDIAKKFGASSQSAISDYISTITDVNVLNNLEKSVLNNVDTAKSTNNEASANVLNILDNIKTAIGTKKETLKKSSENFNNDINTEIQTNIESAKNGQSYITSDDKFNSLLNSQKNFIQVKQSELDDINNNVVKYQTEQEKENAKLAIQSDIDKAKKGVIDLSNILNVRKSIEGNTDIYDKINTAKNIYDKYSKENDLESQNLSKNALDIYNNYQSKIKENPESLLDSYNYSKNLNLDDNTNKNIYQSQKNILSNIENYANDATEQNATTLSDSLVNRIKTIDNIKNKIPNANLTNIFTKDEVNKIDSLHDKKPDFLGVVVKSIYNNNSIKDNEKDYLINRISENLGFNNSDTNDIKVIANSNNISYATDAIKKKLLLKDNGVKIDDLATQFVFNNNTGYSSYIINNKEFGDTFKLAFANAMAKDNNFMQSVLSKPDDITKEVNYNNYINAHSATITNNLNKEYYNLTGNRLSFDGLSINGVIPGKLDPSIKDIKDVLTKSINNGNITNMTKVDLKSNYPVIETEDGSVYATNDNFIGSDYKATKLVPVFAGVVNGNIYYGLTSTEDTSNSFVKAGKETELGSFDTIKDKNGDSIPFLFKVDANGVVNAIKANKEFDDQKYQELRDNIVKMYGYNQNINSINKPLGLSDRQIINQYKYGNNNTNNGIVENYLNRGK